MSQDFKIQDFYDNKSVFITGATGFVGKFVVEKLISSTSVKNVFILIREKRGKSILDRFSDFKNDQVFKFRCDKSKLDQVLIPIAGDVSESGLGLSQESKSKLSDNVNIVIHCAATVRFTEPLEIAIKMNVCGSLEVLQLCSSLSNLQSLVYVSTGFVNSHLDQDIAERYQPLDLDFDQLLQDSSTDNIKKIIKQNKISNFLGHPNTYTMSKNIAEKMMISRSAALSIPLIIVRPVVVTPACDKIFEYYTDSLTQGEAVVVMNYGLALIRNIPASKNGIIPVIPVDKVANSILVAAHHVATTKISTDNDHNTDIKIIVVAEDKFRVSNWLLNQWISSEAIKSPSLKALRVPKEKHVFSDTCHGDKKVKFYHSVNFLLRDYLFAIMIDIILFFTTFGKSRNQPSITKTVCKIKGAFNMLSFFMSKEWPIRVNNLQKITSRLSSEDQIMFNCHDYDDNQDLESYMRGLWHGILKFQLKEDGSKIILARKRIQKLQVVFHLLNIILISFSSIMIAYLLSG